MDISHCVGNQTQWEVHAHTWPEIGIKD